MVQPTLTLGARYETRGVLGEGGMGKVFLVHDMETGDQAALKLLIQGEAVGEADILRFKQEFRAMSRLRHPNVCEVRDFGTTPEGAPFYTMEVVPGQGLDERRGLDPAAVLPLLAQMAAALGYVHAQGYVHSDVKPENFRVTPEGVVKLMDFGLMIPAGQRQDGIAGTLAYLSPEAARGDRLDQRSDLYGLGAVLYELLTGEPPIRGATPLEILRGHLRETPPPVRATCPQAPEALDRAIMRLLAKEPAARFASAAELLAALGMEAAIDEDARLLESPFVGRAAELDRLDEALRELGETGKGGVLRLVGPAGVGKSRLLDELRVHAQLAGRPVIAAAASRDEAPFAPFVAAVRAALPLAREGCPAVLAAEGPALARLLPELATDAGAGDDGEESAKLQAGLARVLAAALGHARGVLVLDAWDLADGASRAALSYLVRNAAAFGGLTGDRPPFLIVVACREAVEGAELELGGLALADSAAMAAGMLGRPEPLPTSLAAQLHGLTEGTPRAIAGLLAHAVATGAITRARGAWQVPDALPPEALSTDVRATLAERLAPLPAAARRAARAGALLAEPFGLGLLGAAAGLDDDDAIDAAAALVRQGVLDADHGRYRFALAELREVLADELGDLDAVTAHRAAAAWIEAHHPAGPADLGLANALARHQLAGGEAGPAVRAVIAVAERNRALGAVDTTVALLERALTRAGELPDTAEWQGARVDLLNSLAQALVQRYEVAAANERGEAAIALAEALGDKRRLGLALASKAMRGTMQGGKADEIVAAHERAIALARESGDVNTQLRAGTNHGRWLVLSGQAAKGREFLDAALALAREAKAPFWEARALSSLGYAHAAEREGRDAGIQLLREAIALQATLRDRYGEGYSSNLLTDVLMRAGRFEEAVETAAAGSAIMREINSVDDMILLVANEAKSALELGDAARAARAAGEALELARAKGHKVGIAYAGALLGQAHAMRGEPEQALPLLKEADEAARGLGGFMHGVVLPHVVEGYLIGGALATGKLALNEGVFALRGSPDADTRAMLAALQATAAAADGNWQEAAAQAADARTAALEVGADACLARALAVAAVAEAAQENGDQALRLADQAQAVAGRCGLRPIMGVLACLRGELALATNPPEAMSHFHAMQVLADGVGAPLLRARALYGQFQALPTASHAPGLLDQAQRAIRELADRLPEGDKQALLAAPISRDVLARNPAVAEIRGAGGGAGLNFADQFARVNTDLQQLFSQYGALQKEWEQSLARLRRLNELAGRMGSTLKLDEVLPQVVALTLEITGAERGFVVLRGTDRYGNLACRAAFDREGRALAATDWSLSICQKVVAADQAIAILDASADADFQAAKSIVAFNIRTVMGVPLKAKGELLGVLYVDSSAVVTTFTEAELELLRGIALHAAVAIDNARLYEEMSRHASELEDALAKYRQAEKNASTDQLTGLPNRRKFIEECEREIGLARRFGHPLSVILLDVDHFKSFNDTYGHAVGDDVLKAVGKVLPAHVGPGELPARLGGEEFTVLVPGGDAPHAAAIAERIREAIMQVVITDYEGKPVRQITASLGVATLHADDRAIGDALERADAALYACKRGGRNQVQIWREGMTTHA